MALYTQYTTHNEFDSRLKEWNRFIDAAVNEYKLDSTHIGERFTKLFDGYWNEASLLYNIGRVFRPLYNCMFLEYQLHRKVKHNFKYISRIALRIWNILKQNNCIEYLIHPKTENNIHLLGMVNLQPIVCLIPQILYIDLKNSDIIAELWNQAIDFHPSFIKMYRKIPSSKFGEIYEMNKERLTNMAKKYMSEAEFKQFENHVKASIVKNPQHEFRFSYEY